MMRKPPSIVIKDVLKSSGSPPTDEEVKSVVKSVLLSEHEVRIWIDHLETVARNRMRGTAQAAATRRAKKQRKKLQTFCGICNQPYEDETEEI